MVELQFPLEYIDTDGNKQIIKQLEFHRIQTKHLKRLPPGTFSADGEVNPAGIGALIAACCRIPSIAADEVDMRDIEEVSKGMAPFLPKSR